MSAKTEKFLVETMAVQLSFSATQTAFAALSAQRVQQRNLHRDVVVVPAEEIDPEAAASLPLAFPLDAFRGQEEGREVLQVLASGKVNCARDTREANPTSSLLARSEVLVDDAQALEEVLPKARSMHIAVAATMAALSTPVTTDGPSHTTNTSGGGQEGGLCVPVTHRAVSLLTARQISHTELFAELVVMTNTNVALSHAACCSTQDHVLNLARSFFSGGVPCVLMGLWCTPDMKPSVLFTKFYELLQSTGCWQRTAAYKGNSNGNSSTRRSAGRRTDSISEESDGATDTDGNVGSGEGDSHKAVILAKAVRALFSEDASLRYSPRLWAGYYCIGCDDL